MELVVRNWELGIRALRLGPGRHRSFSEGGFARTFFLMFTSETKIRVRYAETDQMQVVYHGNYAQYFEVARAECIRELGFTYKDMEAIGIMMPIVELHTKFLRPAHYDELLTIKVILKDLPTDHRVEFHHEVYNEKEKLLTLGKVVLYFVDAKTREKTNMPVELREKIAKYFE